MLMHLPIVILVSLPFTLVADTLPKFDIARECQQKAVQNPRKRSWKNAQKTKRKRVTNFHRSGASPARQIDSRASRKPAWTVRLAMSNCLRVWK